MAWKFSESRDHTKKPHTDLRGLFGFQFSNYFSLTSHSVKQPFGFWRLWTGRLSTADSIWLWLLGHWGLTRHILLPSLFLILSFQGQQAFHGFIYFSLKIKRRGRISQRLWLLQCHFKAFDRYRSVLSHFWPEIQVLKDQNYLKNRNCIIIRTPTKKKSGQGKKKPGLIISF